MKPYALGTVSHGTMKPDDIASALLSHFHMMDDDSPFGGGLVNDLQAVAADGDHEHGWEILEHAFQTIEESDRFPAFCYFGSHEGDGSDFGIWVGWDWVNEACEYGEILRVSDLSEVAETHGSDDAAGYVLHVNDHGNASLYVVRDSGTLDPVWEVV